MCPRGCFGKNSSIPETGQSGDGWLLRPQETAASCGRDTSGFGRVASCLPCPVPDPQKVLSQVFPE